MNFKLKVLNSQIIMNLAANGEKRLAASIHENDFTISTGTSHVIIYPKNKVPFGIIHSKSITVEKQRLLPNS